MTMLIIQMVLLIFNSSYFFPPSSCCCLDQEYNAQNAKLIILIITIRNSNESQISNLNPNS